MKGVKAGYALAALLMLVVFALMGAVLLGAALLLPVR